jgi:hypothetical protein
VVSVAWSRLSTDVRYALSRRVVRRRIYQGIGLLLLAGAAWIIVTAILLRSQLQTMRDDLMHIRQLVAVGRLADARVLAAQLPDEARRIGRLSSGPAWWLAAQVPYLGAPLDTVRGLSDGIARVGADAVPKLVDVVDKIDPAHLRVHGNSVNLAELAAATPDLEQAAQAFDATLKQVDGLSFDTWLSSVNSSGSSVVAQLHYVGGYVDAAARAARILPDMLGAQRPMRYFIGLQNEAEMRGTGGLPGAFAIAVASHGTVHFTRFESDSALLPSNTPHQTVPTGLDFGPGYKAAYAASAPTAQYQDSNVSPYFPYAAQIWARMWEKFGHEHIDGAIAMDPAVLSMLLAVTGPVRVPEGVTVSAQNVVSLTERDEYVMFADNAARKTFLVNVLKKAALTATSGKGSASALAQAFVQASGQHRFLVWSAEPQIEQALQQTSYGGVFAGDDRPLAAPILNNEAAGKLDFYLSRSLDYTRTGCGATRDVLATITLTNNAPASGLPPYVTTRLDKDVPPGAKPGDNRTLVDFYATKGALLESVTLNGKQTEANVQSDLGRPIFRFDLELPRGTTQTLVLHLTEPAGKGTPQIWAQPGVNPMAVSAYIQTCGS